MAKGSKSKEQIVDILLKAFGDRAFLNGKELRLNWAEDGEPLQIAISLTMKKDFIEQGQSFVDNEVKDVKVERCGAPTEAEIAQVIEFMRQIGGLVE